MHFTGFIPHTFNGKIFFPENHGFHIQVIATVVCTSPSVYSVRSHPVGMFNCDVHKKLEFE